MMTETGSIDRPSVAKPVSRPRSTKPATVSASTLAQHLDCSRTYIGKLEAEGVIQRQGDGFPLDQSRVAYLHYLRRERRQSPRGEADADFQRAKSELIRLRIAEKQRQLIPLEEAVGHMDELVGLFISRLSGFAARCGGRDLAARRVIDQAVYDLRLEISEAATKLADQRARLGPGWVPTKMGGAGAPDDIEKAHRTQVWLATSDEPAAAVSGRYFFHQRIRDADPTTMDVERQDLLLDMCRRVSGAALTAS